MGRVSVGVGGCGRKGVVVCGERGEEGGHVGEVIEAFHGGENSGIVG